LLCDPADRLPSASATIPIAMSTAAIQVNKLVLAPVDARAVGASVGADEAAATSG
jgi:hypothetical protein